MLNLDPDILLAIEMSALAMLVAFGLWRIFRTGPSALNAAADEPPYDMRRDGQRLGAM